jgi:hypothetical protein
MHYIVGWTELPAASVAISATEILDYVTSRTLEDFEYRLSLERDEEEAAEQRKKEAKARKSAVSQVTVVSGISGITPVAGKKKRGRPR